MNNGILVSGNKRRKETIDLKKIANPFITLENKSESTAEELKPQTFKLSAIEG